MKLYISGYKQKANVADYPTEIDIKTKADMIRAVSFDHIASQMAGNHRHLNNFMGCDCIMVDIDNTHSEDPEAWKTEGDIADAFPVNYVLVRSRNYMKEKRKTNNKTGQVTVYEPREKWHVYFPLAKPITKKADHARLIRHILCMFPFIDPAAIDSSHFFFAVPDPYITYETGDCNIDEYIENFDSAALKNEELAAVNDFVKNVFNGTYKNDRATKAVIETACSFLGISSPYVDENIDFKEPDASSGPDESDETGGAPDWIERAEQTKTLQWLRRWASDHSVDLYEAKAYIIKTPPHANAIAIPVTCPWEEEHSENGAFNEAVIIVDQDGRLNFLCRHSHGAALSWKDYRAFYEKDDPDIVFDTATQTIREVPAGSQPAAQEVQTAAPAQAPAPGPAQDPAQLPQNAADFLRSGAWDKAVTVFGKYKDRKTGFDNLDEKNGFYPGVYLINAGTSMGKTTFCVQLADQLAARGEHILYFAFEQGSFDLIAKSITREAAGLYSARKHDPKYNAVRIRQGFEDPNVKLGKENYLGYAERVHYVDCAFGWTIDRVAQYITAYVNKTHIAPVVFIDYLQVIKPNDERVSDIKAIDYSVQTIRKLQMNSQDAGFPITFMVISSVSRDNYTKEADISAGKGSGGLEFTADVVLGMQPRIMVTPRYKRAKEQTKRNMVKKAKSPGPGKPREIMIECTKNRFGRPDFAVGFDYYPANETFIPDEGFDKWYEDIKQKEAAAARAAEKKAAKEEQENIKAMGEDDLIFTGLEVTEEKKAAIDLLDNIPFE